MPDQATQIARPGRTRGDRRPGSVGHAGAVTEPIAPGPQDVKQVIVIRRDLKMRRGKEIAQGSHASSAWIARLVTEALDAEGHRATVELDEVASVWLRTSHRKITLQVQTEDELVELHQAARAAGLRSELITDSGKTEFGGQPTVTALAIGPDLAEAIDRITGELRIY